MFDVVKKLNAMDSPKVAAFQAYIGLSGSQEDLKLPANNYFWFKSNDVMEIDNYLRFDISTCPYTSKNYFQQILEVI